MSTEAKVGIFLIVSVLVLGTAVYAVRRTQNVRGQVVYATRVRDAGGLAADTPVLFAGIRVGQVISVRPSPPDPTQIEITFSVTAGTPVNAECIARVGHVTLMGAPALFLSSGSNNARRLRAGEDVQSQEAVSQDEIAARLATLADNASELMVELKKEIPAIAGEAHTVLANLGEITGQTNQKHIQAVLAELDTMVRRESPKIAQITERMTSLTSRADELVGSVKPVVANLDHTITNISTTVDAVREPLTNDLAELKRTLEGARALVDGLQRVLGDNQGDIQEMVRSLRTASDNVRVLSETLKERPWNLIRTSQPADRKVPR
jgi:ABC-type transporter Mla subunit MlaD